MNTKIQNILVTGGAGFIGSTLVDTLIQKNYAVTILDDLSTGKKENINPQATFIKGSMTDENIVEQAVKNQDAIIHLASQVSVIKAIENPEETFHINIDGTKNIIRAAKKNNIQKIVLASSCAVYGDKSGAIAEDAPLSPLNAYAESKQEMEKLCQKSNIPSCIFRFFNVYGPRQDASSQYAAVIPIFITRALQKKELIIFGDGNQTRDFVFVEDIVATLIKGMTELTGLYNVGTGNAISINNLAKNINALSQNPSGIVHKSAREGEILTSIANPSKLLSTQHNFLVSFEEGLQRTIKYLESTQSQQDKSKSI